MRELDKDSQHYVFKISGELVDILMQIATEVYGPSVVIERGKKVLYLGTVRHVGKSIAALQKMAQ